MALRIKQVIHKLIQCDQTAYVHGRNIGESIRVIDDMLEYVDKISEEGILFAVDIEKAFDSVDHFHFCYSEKVWVWRQLS